MDFPDQSGDATVKSICSFESQSISHSFCCDQLNNELRSYSLEFPTFCTHQTDMYLYWYQYGYRSGQHYAVHSTWGVESVIRCGVPQDSCKQNSAISCWLPKDTQSLRFMLQFCRQSSLWRLLQSCRCQFPCFKATADVLIWAAATAGHQYNCT